MFLGTYKHQIDQKNRIRIPSKFKQGISDTMIVAKGTNQCLFLLPQNSDLFEKLSNLPVFDLEIQKSVRAIMSSCHILEEDQQGRVLLPKELLIHAKISKNIVFVGVGNRIEIWAEELWNNYNLDTFDSAINSLKGLGV